MTATEYARRLRLTVVGCGLCGLLVVHVAVRYLLCTLFGFEMYRGLDPIVPLLVVGVYSVAFGVFAVSTAHRHGAPGVIAGIGLLLFALEPLTSTATVPRLRNRIPFFSLLRDEYRNPSPIVLDI